METRLPERINALTTMQRQQIARAAKVSYSTLYKFTKDPNSVGQENRYEIRKAALEFLSDKSEPVVKRKSTPNLCFKLLMASWLAIMGMLIYLVLS
jgi:transposase